MLFSRFSYSTKRYKPLLTSIVFCGFLSSCESLPVEPEQVESQVVSQDEVTIQQRQLQLATVKS